MIELTYIKCKYCGLIKEPMTQSAKFCFDCFVIRLKENIISPEEFYKRKKKRKYDLRIH